MAHKVGDYEYASSHFLKSLLENKIRMGLRCFDSALIVRLHTASGLLNSSESILNKDDEDHLLSLHQAKFKKKDKVIIRLKKKPLNDYDLLNCDKETRSSHIVRAVFDGYRQSEIAEYLGVSNVLISKLMKFYRTKCKLFEKYKMYSMKSSTSLASGSGNRLTS